MRDWTLALHPGLADASRLPASRRQAQAELSELLLLVLAGCVAALAVMLLDFSWKIPGHAILRAVFPMACGLALVPRRLGGLVMGLSAALTLSAGGLARLELPGWGATTSLLCLGPVLDVILARASTSWRVWIGFAFGGLAANLVALAVQGSLKWSSGTAGFAALDGWIQRAAISYPLCGLAAGLISAIVWFRLSNPPANQKQLPDTPPAH